MMFKKLVLLFFVLFFSAQSQAQDGTLPWPFLTNVSCPMNWDGVFKTWTLKEGRRKFYFTVSSVREVAGGRIIEVTKTNARKKAVAYGRSYVPEGQNFIAMVLLRVNRDTVEAPEASWLMIGSGSKLDAYDEGYGPLTKQERAAMCSEANITVKLMTKPIDFSSASKRSSLIIQSK